MVPEIGDGVERDTFPAVRKAADQLASIFEQKGGEQHVSQDVFFPIKLTTLDVTGAYHL